MPILRHLLVALIYAMVAAAVAIALPRLVPSVGMETGLTIGGALLLAFALLHEIFSRQEQQSRLAEEIQDLRLSHGDVMRELNLARGEVGGIHEALAGFKGARVSQDFQKDFDHMVSEVRMLQNLVTRLTAPPAHAADEAADHGFQGPIDRTTPAVDAPPRGARAAAILALVGFVNVPIIKFSVEWWNTLLQSSSVVRLDGPSIHPSMLWPLLLMALGFTTYFIVVVILRLRAEIAARKVRALRLSQTRA